MQHQVALFVAIMKILEWFTGIALDVTYVIVFSYQKYYHKFLCLNKNVINAIIFNSCKYIRLPEFEISNDTDLDDPSVLVTSKAVYTH